MRTLTKMNNHINQDNRKERNNFIYFIPYHISKNAVKNTGCKIIKMMMKKDYLLG